MRAIVLKNYGDADQLVEGSAPEPLAGPDDLLIEIHATSVNPVDAKLRAGAQRAVVRLQLPAILGMDLSGVVTDVGSNVIGFAKGDEVFASPSHRRMGTYAEQIAVRAAEVARKPTSINHLAAASLPLVALTAWDSLVRFGKLKAGQRVLVQAGAGGVGTMAIQIAKHLGAEVFATCSARNRELVENLGARSIDYGSERYEDVARDVDLVVECLGGEHLGRCLTAVRPQGRIICLMTGLAEAAEEYGPALGVAVTAFNLASFALRAFAEKGVTFMPIARKPDGGALSEIAAMVDKGALRPVLDRVMPLEDMAEAHRLIEGGRTRGKIVIATR